MARSIALMVFRNDSLSNMYAFFLSDNDDNNNNNNNNDKGE